ncbi:MAG: FAD-dependent oxidoreductase [Planctomycetota bacterium]
MQRAIRGMCPVLCLLLAATSSADVVPPEPGEPFDVVIYGGTSAGVAAAVQAARMGKSVVVVSPDEHLGGLSSGGLGWTDSGRKEVIGGIAREFYQRIKQHYDRPQAWIHQKPEEYERYRPSDDAMWVFEPHVAEATFERLIAEHKVRVDRGQWLDRSGGVKRDGARVESITTLGGRTYRGRMFIDATYEGDLMAAGGVSYAVGRESNAQYGETLNGVQTKNAVHHQFLQPVDPYVVPGDPSSGLLPRISAGPPGEEGSGDHCVQAYCFRMCLTTAPENRLPFPKPPGYDPLEYELLARCLQTGWDGVFRKFDPAPNWKTDTNNHGPFSTDNIGMNYDYPEASYERRREIIREHELYQKGLMYFLANDPRVPEKIHQEMSRWGLAKDEFAKSGNWPHQIYVREARRMVSRFVMTERHLRCLEPTPEPIGMGSYNMDSHHVERYVDADGTARNEGDVEISPGGPYPVSYRAITPKASECANLLVPVCLSASHIAYGSIRMEPVFMILGQSAATAACQAIDQRVAVQEIDPGALRERLLADKQALEWTGPRRQPGISPASLSGIVIDDQEAELTGPWASSSSVGGFVHVAYRHDGNEAKGKLRAVFRPTLPKAGRYEVRVAFTPNPNRATNVPVTIVSADGAVKITVNQRKPLEDGPFLSLGQHPFAAGDQGCVIISNEGTDGYVVIDAVQFIPEE